MGTPQAGCEGRMLALLPLVPGASLLGFGILLASGGALPRRWIAVIGVGSVALSMILALLVSGAFLISPHPYDQVIWSWIAVDIFTPHIGFHLDALSLVMMLVITFVGFLIHLYSAEFMGDDEGYNRYFAYMNLFVGAMLILVLADNLLLLYLGWEGVGLCSYLLIGFWYRDAANGRAARKAFIVTRIGDTAMAIGIFFLFANLETLDIQHLMRRAVGSWPVGSQMATTAAALLLGGALGKSAQVPLQVWLPDAMAGPTPVSALIHAATMVTAGVYLIARLNALYELAPSVRGAVAAIGVLTLLLGSFSALNQNDIKRILAYSTISQIGYMFLALGVGAWSAAIFHFMTHAFFKALLFLSAGVVIQRLGEEHDIFKMGGLRRRLPLAFWSFLIGSASLASVPLITAGFYSKDRILSAAWSSGPWGGWLWAAGVSGAFLTAFYIFRAVFIAFFGEVKVEPHGCTGSRVAIPLVVLSVLALVAGFVEIPSFLGGAPNFGRLMQSALPELSTAPVDAATEAKSMAISGIVALFGVYAAYVVFHRRPAFVQIAARAPASLRLANFWARGWGFDWLYGKILVQPFLLAAHLNRADFIDAIYGVLATSCEQIHHVLSRSQTGRVRWYAAGIVTGAVLAVAVAVLA
jgi:NADH-quinone oxidoreductase subunit L